jgi:hypothetical protein
VSYQVERQPVTIWHVAAFVAVMAVAVVVMAFVKHGQAIKCDANGGSKVVRGNGQIDCIDAPVGR